jgi:RNA polymerase sigma-70 factor (ECF subfamily)
VGDRTGEPSESSVEADHLHAEDSPLPGGWIPFPLDWTTTPDEHLLSQETQSHIWACIDALPRGQRQVVVLRDVHGCSAEETSKLLQISEVNQRVLLHRGRSKVRRGLEAYLAGT